MSDKTIVLHHPSIEVSILNEQTREEFSKSPLKIREVMRENLMLGLDELKATLSVVA